MGGEAGAESDARHAARLRMQRHRHRAEQDHGRLVAGGNAVEGHGQFRIRLAVGADAQRTEVGIGHQADGRGLSVAVVLDLLPVEERDAVAIDAGSHLPRVEAHHGSEQRHAERPSYRERHWDPASGETRRGGEHQDRPQRDVESSSQREEVLQPQGGQTDVDGEEDARDRAQRIGGVDRPDASLSVTALEQMEGDQRQSGPGAEGRRQHDRERKPVAGQIEQGVPEMRLFQIEDQPAHRLERLAVREQGREGQDAHGQL